MAQSVVIIDYGSGNLRSAAKAFERAITETGSNLRVVVTNDPKQVQSADRIVLPGVGAFGDCMAGLVAIDGMIDALVDVVIHKAQPFLGICVGMQLMATTGYEHGEHAGLGWIPGYVELIKPAKTLESPGDSQGNPLKIPHMGWNTLQLLIEHPVFSGIADGSHVYFVHSNHLVPEDSKHCLSVVEYGGAVTAVVGRDNMVGVQFHPEKSQASGIDLICNFLTWRP